jgi:hypothetical protein
MACQAKKGTKNHERPAITSYVVTSDSGAFRGRSISEGLQVCLPGKKGHKKTQTPSYKKLRSNIRFQRFSGSIGLRRVAGQARFVCANSRLGSQCFGRAGIRSCSPIQREAISPQHTSEPQPEIAKLKEQPQILRICGSSFFF